MSLERNNSSHAITGMAFNPLFITLHFSQQFFDIINGNMRSLYDAFSYKNKKEDPFEKTKKKCLPESIDHLTVEEKGEIKKQTNYYSSIQFTIEKRDGASFSDKTMNNLIIDDKDTLIQLVYSLSPTSAVPPGQRVMEVTIYTKGSKTVARKFERYI
ncbi:hypothetical protein HOO68_03755 [Candidatus Gracilibacteria bacterium]|nr:hypothetical protein [Candidatus Gracilibacteria bacterium]